MDKIALSALQTFLNQNDIPVIKGRPKTFLGIAKQPHYENVLSNIYSFFFSVNEVHKMDDLFVTSLLQIVNNKKSESGIQYLNDFEVATEVSTKKGGRIDLLLFTSETAIIIENKVYHKLNNNLNDYWGSVDQAQKIGIVLSLNPISVENPNFINITHLELVKKIMENSGRYLIEARDKYVIFLKDFYQNIINLSKTEMNAKELGFYYNNQEKINEVENFLIGVRQHISNQVEIACGILDEPLKLQTPKSENKNRLRYYLSPANSNLMFTIVYDGLWQHEKQIILIVELANNLLSNRNRYKSISFTEEEKELLCYDFYDKKGYWAHFASKGYTLNNEEVQNLSSFIVKKLEEDFLLSIFRKLNEFISKQN